MKHSFEKNENQFLREYHSLTILNLASETVSTEREIILYVNTDYIGLVIILDFSKIGFQIGLY